MSTLHSLPARNGMRRSGFTLIEVAIALALFVIGALAIVRIFPPALQVIRNNESRVRATQMGESVLARMASKYSSAPEAIFDINSSSTAHNKWNDYAGAVVGTINKNDSLAKSPTETDYSASALAHFRYVYGEPRSLQAGQTIILSRPVDTTAAAALGTPYDVPRIFYDSIVDGVAVSEDGYLDFSNAYLAHSGIPAIDESYGYSIGGSFHDTNSQNPPANARITNADTSQVTYYVSYRWREYQGPPATNYSAIRGVSEEPLTARTNISVTADRPRLLPCAINSANKIVPGVVTVRLRRYPPITVTGTGTADSRIYSFTAPYTGTYHFSYLSSDWRTQAEDLATPDVDTYLNQFFGKNGATIISQVPNGQRTRVIYTTTDAWVVQPSVSARTYAPFVATFRNDANFPREPWREYHWDGAGNLYFHASEAGKSIALSYMDPVSNTAVSDVILTVDDTLIDATSSGVPGGFSTNKVSRVEISDASGNPVSPSGILSIKGLSVQARTAWINNDRYNQVIVPGYRNLTTNN